MGSTVGSISSAFAPAKGSSPPLNCLDATPWRGKIRRVRHAHYRPILPENCKATSKILGASTKEGFGVQGGGLQAKGYIVGSREEGVREIHFTITPAGRAALQTAG